MEKKECIIPVVCGVISGQTDSEFKLQLREAEKHEIEIVEWRLDAMVKTIETLQRERETLVTCIDSLKLANKRVILTLRSVREGGLFKGDASDYFRVISEIENLFDFWMVDIEYARYMENEDGLSGKLPGRGGKRIVSHHDFEKIPEKSEILGLFRKMAAVDAAFVKGAFMAEEFSDTLRLISAAVDFKRDYPEKGLVYMAMGGAGMASRILAGEAASAITYASLDAKKTTAPGQVQLARLSELINLQRMQIQGE